MTAEEIKSRLHKKKLNQLKLAKRFRVSPTAIHFLIHGQLKSRDLQKKLARALGVKLDELRGDNGEQRGAN